MKANASLEAVLERIAASKRPDGTYNLSREACGQLARSALSRLALKQNTQRSHSSSARTSESVANHRCSYDNCDNSAVMVYRDTDPAWPTFDHGAGYVCHRHAALAMRSGCIKA